MKRILLVVFIFIFSDGRAQNLVNNPGFENYSSLPSGAAQWNLAVGWSNCSGGGSPDYAHTAGTGLAALPNNYFATVSPHSGDAIMGLILWHYSGNFREYISTSLSSPLVPGTLYDVSFYITNGVFNGNYGGFSCDQVSVAFSVSPLIQTGSGVISVVPEYVYPGQLQDSAWVLVSFQFTASQAFNYITIGNFVDDANTGLSQYASSGFDAAYYFVDDVSVEVANALPVAVFLAANDICPGTCTDFTNLSTNATSYLWDFPGANPSVSTDVNPANICYNTPGQYGVQLIASNANGSDTLFLNNYITVYPFPPPQGITQNGDTLFANPGAAGYQWYHDGVLIPGATDYYYVAAEGGDYNVVATDANGCEVEAVIFDIVAGLPAISGGDPIAVFPNPVFDVLHVRSGETGEYAGDGIEKNISIFSILGEKVFAGQSAFHDGLMTVPCGFLKPGMYWFEIVSGKNILRSRFVKSGNR